MDGAPYDFSFSGLKTAVLNIINSLKQKGEEVNVPDLGASYINAVVDCLCGNTQKAAENLGYKKIVLAGGVSANSVLRRRMTELCQKKNWSLYYPELKYCGDNGAMVAAQGYYEFVGGNTASLDLNAVASLSIE